MSNFDRCIFRYNLVLIFNNTINEPFNHVSFKLNYY